MNKAKDGRTQPSFSNSYRRFFGENWYKGEMNLLQFLSSARVEHLIQTGIIVLLNIFVVLCYLRLS